MTKALKATLYLGGNIPGGDTISEDDFASFLAESVTPHFPGFTIRTNVGYWKGEPETVRELVILADANEPQFAGQIRWIAEHYKTRFAQEGVMYDIQDVSAEFNVWPHGPVAAYHRPGLGY